MTKKSKKAAAVFEAALTARVDALVSRIMAADAARRVRYCYNGSHGNAETSAPAGSEAYDWAQHDHAIENVFNLLYELNLLVDGDDERVVSRAYSDIS